MAKHNSQKLLSYQVKSKLIFTLIFVLLLVCVYKLRAQNEDQVVSNEEGQQQYHRILGEYKQKYCVNYIKNQTSTVNGKEVTKESIVTSDQINEAKMIKEQLEQIRSPKTDEIKQIVTSYKASDDYTQSLILTVIPLCLLCLFSILGWFFYIICCACDKWCPPCESCRRDTKEKPYEMSELNCPGYILVLFCAVGIGAGVFGFMVANGINDITGNIRCSIIGFLDDVNYGIVYDNVTWIGLAGAQIPITNLTDQIDILSQKVTDRFSNTQWIDEDSEELYTTNSQLYENYKNSKVVFSPQPNSPNMVDSLYIQRRLGPETLQGTTTFNIRQSITGSVQMVVDSLNIMKDAAENVKINSEALKQALFNARTQINGMSNKFVNYIKTAEEYLNKPEEKQTQINVFSLAFFGGSVAGAGLAVLGLILTHCMGQNPKMRILLHLGWFVMCVFMIIGFMMTIILLPVGLATNDSCVWLNGFLHNASEFNSSDYDNFITKDVKNKLSVCLFGDGNLIREFNFTNDLDQLTNVKEKLKDASKVVNPLSPNKIDMNIATIAIDLEKSYITDVMQSKIADSEALDETSHVIVLENMLSWSDYNTNSPNSQQESIGGCNYLQDEWVLHTDNCIYNTLFPQNGAVGTNLGSQVCIQVNYLDPVKTAQRYADVTANCNSQTYNRLIDYFNSLWKYDIAKRGLFTSILNDVNVLRTANLNFINKVGNFYSVMEQFDTDLTAIGELITNEKTGLVSNFNCKFVNKNIDLIYDSVCINLFPPLFKITLAIGICSLGLFFASFATCLLGLRYSKLNGQVVQDDDD